VEFDIQSKLVVVHQKEDALVNAVQLFTATLLTANGAYAKLQVN